MRVSSNRGAIVLFLVVIASLGVRVAPALELPPGEYIAFSLAEAERQHRGQVDGSDLNSLGGIGELKGVLIEESSREIILIGRPHRNLAPLTLDDFTALLQATTHSVLGSGVSLEPRGGGVGADSLDVVLLGGLRPSRVAQSLVQVDYLMKQLGLGILPLEVDGIESYWSRTKARLEGGKVQPWRLLSRFWFYPLYAPLAVNARQDLAILSRIKVGVDVETLEASMDQDSTSAFVEDTAARGYARDFERLFNRVAEHHAPLRDLERILGAWVIADWMLVHAPHDWLRYWLEEVSPRQVPMEDRLPVLRRKLQRPGAVLEVCGGIRLAALGSRLEAGDLDALREAIQLVRPDAASLAWRFSLSASGALVAASAEESDREVGALFAHALRSFQRSDFVAALACLDQVQNVQPDLAEARFLGAVCSRDLAIRSGKPAEAEPALETLALLRSELPEYLDLRFEHAFTLDLLGHASEATEEYARILEADSTYAPAHYRLGVTCYGRGEDQPAREHLSRFLKLQALSLHELKTTPGARRPSRNARRILGELQHVPSPTEMKQYCSHRHGFCISHPTNWREYGAGEVRCILPSSGSTKNIAVAFQHPRQRDTVVNIQVVAFDRRQLTNALVEDTFRGLDARNRKRHKKFRRLSAGRGQVGSHPALEYAGRYERSGIAIRQHQTTIFGPNRAYVLTLTSTESDFEEVWHGCFGAMRESFHLAADAAQQSGRPSCGEH